MRERPEMQIERHLRVSERADRGLLDRQCDSVCGTRRAAPARRRRGGAASRRRRTCAARRSRGSGACGSNCRAGRQAAAAARRTPRARRPFAGCARSREDLAPRPQRLEVEPERALVAIIVGMSSGSGCSRPSRASRRASCVFGSAQSRPTIATGIAASSISSTIASAIEPFSLSKPTMNPAVTNMPAA